MGVSTSQFPSRSTLVGRFIIAHENTLVTLPAPPTGNNSSNAGDTVGNEGLLTRRFVNSIISDNERARAAFANRRGATRKENGTTDQRRSLVILLITDRRIIFASPDGDVPADGSVRYGDIASVDIHPGRVTSISIKSVDSVEWRFRLPSADASTIDSVGRHLHWIERVRQEFLELRADIEMAAGVIRDHVDTMDWEEAQQQYRCTRDRLDRFISTLESTTPIKNEVIAPELTQVERTLEKAHVTLYIERARSELELGSYLIEHEDTDRPKEALQRALHFYECATAQQDVVQRADSFEFGTQRTLKQDIKELGWEIEMVAAEPRRQAEEAKLKAQSADNIATAIEYWESALRRYEQALVMELGTQGRQFTGEPEELRTERDIAVEMLLDLCDEYSRSQQQEGLERHRAGRVKEAIRCCETAVTQLERACELATEYNYPEPTDYESRLTELQETITEIRTGEFKTPESGNNKATPDSEVTAGETPSTTDAPGESGSVSEYPQTEVSAGNSKNENKSGELPDDESTLWRSAGGATSQSASESSDSATSLEPLDIPSLDDIKTLDTHSDITLTLADPTEETDSQSQTLGDGLKPPTATDESDPSDSFEAFSSMFATEDADDGELKRSSQTD